MSIIVLASDGEEPCPFCGAWYVDSYSPNYILKEMFGERALSASKCNCGGFTEFMSGVSETELLEKIPFAVKMRSGYFSVRLPVGGWWGQATANKSDENFRRRLQRVGSARK